ncbi:zinc finger protein [Striga asiatica]|uniref:Zinc finger protein n=1 Tax=Striga asiatica TaxID=4170 RepID=A0A5A7P9B6_STRAF|nr:zinc finger protein [Striga asiatica]
MSTNPNRTVYGQPVTIGIQEIKLLYVLDIQAVLMDKRPISNRFGKKFRQRHSGKRQHSCKRRTDAQAEIQALQLMNHKYDAENSFMCQRRKLPSIGVTNKDLTGDKILVLRDVKWKGKV